MKDAKVDGRMPCWFLVLWVGASAALILMPIVVCWVTKVTQDKIYDKWLLDRKNTIQNNTVVGGEVGIFDASGEVDTTAIGVSASELLSDFYYFYEKYALPSEDTYHKPPVEHV